MNKKLLALAVGAALTVPMTASAGVTWYGQLQAEISSENSSTTGGTGTDGKIVQGGGSRFYDGTTVEDNKRGRLGVKASEKLGNGMTAIAKFEWQVSTVTANVNDGTRESFVGLKGGFGTVTLGSNKSPYKYTGGVKYDPFVTTNLEARRYGGMSTGKFGQNSFVSNSISYKTPKMGGGFTGWVTYSPDEQAGTDGDVFASAKFKGGNFEAFVAYAKDDSASFDATKVGGMYKMGMHKFKIQYEMLSDITPGIDGNLLFLGYEGKFGGNNVVVAQYGKGEVKYATKQKNDYWAIGVIHKMSKQTRLFGGYANMTVDNVGGTANANSDRNAFTVGMRKDF